MRAHPAPALLLAAVVGGCTPAELGEEVGTYRVDGTLEEHGCGETAVPTPTQAVFDVTLRADRSAAWWVLAGAEPAPGRADGDGRYTFRRAGAIEVLPPAPDGSTAGCTLVQEDVIDIRVTGSAAVGDAGPAPDAGPAMDGTPDAGPTAPDGFEGTEVFTYRPRSSPGCRPILASQGGAFAALPCEITIALTGTARR